VPLVSGENMNPVSDRVGEGKRLLRPGRKKRKRSLSLKKKERKDTLAAGPEESKEKENRGHTLGKNRQGN